MREYRKVQRSGRYEIHDIHGPYGSRSTFRNTLRSSDALALRRERVLLFDWTLLWSMPPISIHSPSLPDTTVSTRCTLKVWFLGSATESLLDLISRVTRSPLSRGLTRNPVSASRYSTDSEICLP